VKTPVENEGSADRALLPTLVTPLRAHLVGAQQC